MCICIVLVKKATFLVRKHNKGCWVLLQIAEASVRVKVVEELQQNRLCKMLSNTFLYKTALTVPGLLLKKKKQKNNNAIFTLNIDFV